MGKKIRAFVDTSAFISFLDKSDSYHNVFRRLFSEPPELITSSMVIAEGHGWFLKRYDSFKALQFLNFIEDLTPLKIIPIGDKEIKSARLILCKYSDQSLTLVDAIGLDSMKKNRLKSCWSTDRHLGITGVKLIIHEI